MTDPYSITPHTAGTKRLLPKDKSRFNQVMLCVTRERAGRGQASIVVRQVGGGLVRSTRIAVGTFPMADGSLASTDPIEALYIAFNELTGRLPQ